MEHLLVTAGGNESLFSLTLIARENIMQGKSHGSLYFCSIFVSKNLKSLMDQF